MSTSVHGGGLDVSSGSNAVPTSQEMDLLYGERSFDESIMDPHDIRTAPLFTREAFMESNLPEESSQYGVLGCILSIWCV